MQVIFPIIGILIPLSLISGPAISDIFATTMIIFYLFQCYKTKEFDDFLNFYFYGFIIVCIFFITTSVLSSNVLLSFESSLFYIRFGLYALAIMYLCKNYDFFLKYFCFSLIFCLIILSIDSIYQLFFYENFLSIFFNFKDFSYGRIASLFGDEYVLGSYVVRLLPLLCGTIIIVFNKKIKIVLLLLMLTLSSIIIFISGERTALFMLVLFLFLSVLIISEIRKIILLYLVFFIISLFVVLTFNADLKERMTNQTLNQIDINVLDKKINFFTVQHQVVYITSFKIFKDNFITGIGPKLFREICKKDKYKTYSKDDLSIDGCQSHPHNNYIQILTETGIFGFSIFIIIYLILSYNFVNILLFRKQTNLTKKNIIETFSLIAILINFWPLMPTGNFFNNWINIIYYLPIGFYLYSRSK